MENEAPIRLHQIRAWDALLRFLQRHVDPKDSDYLDALLYDIDYGQIQDGRPVTGDDEAWWCWQRIVRQGDLFSGDTVVATPRQLYQVLATFVEEFGDAATSEHIAQLVAKIRQGLSDETGNDDYWID